MRNWTPSTTAVDEYERVCLAWWLMWADCYRRGMWSAASTVSWGRGPRHSRDLSGARQPELPHHVLPHERGFRRRMIDRFAVDSITLSRRQGIRLPGVFSGRVTLRETACSNYTTAAVASLSDTSPTTHCQYLPKRQWSQDRHRRPCPRGEEARLRKRDFWKKVFGKQVLRSLIGHFLTHDEWRFLTTIMNKSRIKEYIRRLLTIWN